MFSLIYPDNLTLAASLSPKCRGCWALFSSPPLQKKKKAENLLSDTKPASFKQRYNITMVQYVPDQSHRGVSHFLIVHMFVDVLRDHK